MASEEDNNPTPTPEDSQESGKSKVRVLPRTLPIVIIMVLMIAVALYLVSHFRDAALPDVTLVGDPAATRTTPAPPQNRQAPQQAQQPPELSPQALEDLRSVPDEDLAINPEPLLLEPVPEDTEATAGEAPEAPAVAGTEETPAPETPAPADEPFSVGEALARYLLAIRNDLNSEYVANCIRFRNRNGAGAGCPENPAFNTGNHDQEKALVDELFAVITRQGDYIRIAGQLERENEALATILEDPDNPDALQARTKLDLNNGYLSYLNGNPNPAVTAFNTMNDFVNDYNRTITIGPTQFRCQGGPCVYEYTAPEKP